MIHLSMDFNLYQMMGSLVLGALVFSMFDLMSSATFNIFIKILRDY